MVQHGELAVFPDRDTGTYLGVAMIEDFLAGR